MENTVKIIPLTDFQKHIYTNFVDIQNSLISNMKGWSAITLHQKYNKNYNDNFPRVNLLQLNSIPDYINGVFLDYSDKQNILLGEIENVKSYSKTLETFKIDVNNNLQYINLKSNPIIIRNLTTLDTLTFESHTTPLFTKDGEEVLKAKIIPATSEQKIQFSEHIQSLIYNLIPVVPYPVLTTEQLNSIPDYIDGKELNTRNKTQLLFEHFFPLSNNTDESISDLKKYTVSNKGELIKTFEYKDKKIRFGNTYKKNISFVKNEDCIYVNKNLSQDNSNSNTVSEPRTMYEQTKKNDMKTMTTLEPSDSEKVKIIPITDEQKEQHSKNWDSDDVEFSKEQLDAIPDVIEGFILTDYNKKLLALTGGVETLYNNETTYKIDENNNLVKYYLEIDENLEPFTKREFVAKNNVSFNNNLTLKTINIMSTNVDFDKAKDLDVVGFERPLNVYDPVSIIHEGKNLQGKVFGLPSNGEIMISISNSKEIKELTVSAKDSTKIVPMFVLNKDEKMVYLKFSYEETIAALNKKEDIVLNHNKNEKSPVFNLMLGNKTDVIPFEKNIDNKMAPVEGRLELRRKAGSGEAYVHGEVKHKELNLALPIYGLHLNEKQKEDLVNKKDIGLIQGFKANDGKEFALWVSLDDKLNKVVTAPERSININMIFGVKTTEEQRNQIKNGEGAVVEIKGKEYLFQASAATTKADGLKSNAIDKKNDLKQDKSEEVDKAEKKSKRKGLKI